jgi:hypothetical protein
MQAPFAFPEDEIACSTPVQYCTQHQTKEPPAKLWTASAARNSDTDVSCPHLVHEPPAQPCASIGGMPNTHRILTSFVENQEPTSRLQTSSCTYASAHAVRLALKRAPNHQMQNQYAGSGCLLVNVGVREGHSAHQAACVHSHSQHSKFHYHSQSEQKQRLGVL